MSDSVDKKWALGAAPNVTYAIPQMMDSLVIHRDQYGQPTESVKFEELPVPGLQVEDATKVLVAVLATGPNFNTNLNLGNKNLHRPSFMN